MTIKHGDSTWKKGHILRILGCTQHDFFLSMVNYHLVHVDPLILSFAYQNSQWISKLSGRPNCHIHSSSLSASTCCNKKSWRLLTFWRVIGWLAILKKQFTPSTLYMMFHWDTIFYILLVSWLSHAIHIWGWVKTLVPSEPQNSWDLWMFIPLKMYL
jgi:hypothetical protein